MKNLTLIISIILSFTLTINAQDVKKPKDINVAEFDDFKNSAFDIQGESGTLLESVTTIESEIKNYSGVMNTIGVEKLRNNFKALTEGVLSSSKLSAELTKLTGQSQELVKKTKSVRPITKSAAASKNTKQSMKALEVGKGNISQINEKIKSNLEILTSELKSRGELIE